MPLRMLVITQNFPQKLIGWSGEFLVRQARFLRARGIESAFIVPVAWAPWPLSETSRWRIYGRHNPLYELEGLPAERVRYLRPPGSAFFRYEHLTMRARVLPLARRWHARTPFDLVMGVQMNGEGATAAYVGRKLGIASAAMAIGTDVRVLPDLVPGLKQTLARTLSEIDLPIAVSHELAQRLEALGPCRNPPFVVRLPRDTTHFRPADDRAALRRSMGLGEDECAFVYVGRLEAPKGMEELCEVTRRLSSRHAALRLFCLGEGSYRARLLEAGARSGAVLAPGRIEPDDVARYMQAADALVLPSHSEGLPQVVLEAMNCGLPVVATDVGGTSEAVRDRETGLLVPARDADALEAAMEELIGDPALRRRMGEAGLRLAAQEFDPEAASDRFAEALRGIVRSKRD